MISRFLSSLPKSPVIVTPQAWKRMETILKSQGSFCFHLDIKSGGCRSICTPRCIC